jgi:hypothetical protein
VFRLLSRGRLELARLRTRAQTLEDSRGTFGKPPEANYQKRELLSYSMMTVDCPEISNRLRQRMFLQAIMSSFRTM